MKQQRAVSLLAVAAVAMLLAPEAPAQRPDQCSRNGGVGGGEQEYVDPNVPYDGRFTFARLAYGGGTRGGGFGRRGYSRNDGWKHDYPRAERHFSRLLVELTKAQARVDHSVVFELDDPELFKYPVAYMSEPGYWRPTEPEVTSLRNYLLKGGFLIFDDFYGQDLVNLVQQMERVLPGMRLIPLDASDPIFDSFFRVRTLDYYHSYYCIKTEFYGIFEDNDPRKRMLAIVNQNADLGEAWEWSADGLFPIQVSNDSYKLGINYVIYALTR